MTDVFCPMCGDAGVSAIFRTKVHERRYSLAHCRRCGLHFCDPPPTAAEALQHHSGDYHAQLRAPGVTEAAFGAKFAGYRDWALQFVQRGRSLDIGTATGLMPSQLRRAGFDAEGIEYNPASAAWGEQHYGVRIHVGDIRQLGDRLGAFDLITATDVIEHAAQPLCFLQTLSERLKTGGHMLVTFPDIRSVESTYALWWAKVCRRDWLWDCCRIPGHVWEFTPSTARAMFEKVGLKVVGFRRRHEQNDDRHPLQKLLFAPLLLLNIPLLGNRFGSQIQFMLRKSS